MATHRWSVRELGSAATNLILVACAIAVVVILLSREVTGRGRGTQLARVQTQNDWRSYLAGGQRVGVDSASVILVEFADFQCPACRAFASVLKDVRAKYPTEFAVLYRHFPLTSIHPSATQAAVASECAARQGRFAEMHDELFARQRELADGDWPNFASAAGVPDLESFRACLVDSASRDAVRRDRDAARRLGASVTPTVLVDGKRFNGTLSLAELDSIVLAARAK